ncbi:chitin synthase III catalytic subunit [Thelephora terrestris]|uniref:Chitin synthase III catalytic subunit n=1 Tax=Thelephora terrestris TaxID=56493 RepID=A0A9P6HLI2_9AGAM|nr:chitin synthase III catalytic subunit [Thelephora terrestris]
MVGFGDFKSLCEQTPSYPWCNLFYRQLENHSPSTLVNLSAIPATAPVGVNPECGIIRAGQLGSLGNIANMIVCGVSMIVVFVLIVVTTRRRAAVGRSEFRIFLVMYFLSLPFQLITTGSVLEQGSTSLVALTGIHAGIVAALFWALLGNAIVSTQVVEDGTLSSLIPLCFFTLAFFGVTTYISLDVALSITSTFGPSNPPSALHSTPLFVLTSIWPGAAAVLYLLIMTWIVLVVLREIRPMWFYILAATLFVLSQLDYFLLNKVICKGANAKVDGSFIATIFETAAVAVLYLAWRSITEESWDDNVYFPN